MAKFFVKGTTTKVNAIKDTEAYKDSIIFDTDLHIIYHNGDAYGVSTELASLINDIQSAIDAIKSFSTVSGNTGSASAPNVNSTLNIKGNAGITTSVDTTGVTVKHTNSITSGKISSETTRTLVHSGTFKIPAATYDALGHITGNTEVTLTLPASGDTHHLAKNIIGASATASANAVTTNTTTFLNLVENNAIRSSHLITGAGTVSVAADATGKLTITGSAHPTLSSLGGVPTTRKVNAGTGLSGGGALTSDITLSHQVAPSSGTAKNTNKYVTSVKVDSLGHIASVDSIAKIPVADVDGLSDLISASDAMRFRGVVDATHALPTAGVKIGDTYKVGATGTYAGLTCEVGDMIIAIAETPEWSVILTNIDGAVTATSTLTNGAVMLGAGTKTAKIAGTVGTTNKGIYLNAGVPTAMTYELNKTVPANAVFTDTNTTYTFTNGTNGSFTVTPSNGKALPVSIGKPATAGSADKLTTARSFILEGDISGTLTFDGTNNCTINASLEWEEL